MITVSIFYHAEFQDTTLHVSVSTQTDRASMLVALLLGNKNMYSKSNRQRHDVQTKFQNILTTQTISNNNI